MPVMPYPFVSTLNPPLKPVNGNTLRVLIMTRISTENQNEQSLDDQEAFCKRYIAQHYNEPTRFTVLQHQASGELVERPDLEEAERLINSRGVDLVIAEDLSRIMRRHNVMNFLEYCEDHDIRLIAINDNIDTATEWRAVTTISTLRHEMCNADTSKRIKRTQDNRFIQGGTLGCLIYGYTKDPGAKTDDGIHKDPAAEPIYNEWFARLEDGASYAEIADWLNMMGIPTGPTCTRPEWDRKMVSRVTHNPILKGVRQRGRLITRRRNSSGKHYTVKAPPDHLKERHCEHLVFIEPKRYDRVLAMVDSRNKHYRRGKNGQDPMAGRPKRRTTWPGQSVCCGVCGRPFVWGGHGKKDHLMCSGAKDYRCWNGVTFGGKLAVTKIADAILDEVEHLPDFEPGFTAMVQQQLAELAGTVEQRRCELTRQRDEIDKKLQNLARFVMNGGDQELALAQQQELKAQRARLDGELAKLDKAAKAQPELPGIDDIKRLAREVFKNLAVNDQAFARKLRKLITVIHVFPVRCITGGHPLPRARFEIKLARLFEGVELLDKVDEHLTLNIEIDLFDPPQPVRHREAVLKHKELTRTDGKPYTERQIADALGVTQPVVQRAIKLHRAMQRLGISDPYKELHQPTELTKKMRRHKHPRYRFEPLPGYGPHTSTPAADADAA